MLNVLQWAESKIDSVITQVFKLIVCSMSKAHEPKFESFVASQLMFENISFKMKFDKYIFSF